MTILLSEEGVKRDWRHKIKCFKRIRYDFSGFHTGFSQKKVNEFLPYLTFFL